MKFKKIGSKVAVRLEKGEKIISQLTNFCLDQGINFGTISAIGGVSQISLGWYELSSEQSSPTGKSYHWQDFSGDLEITSLTGNVAMLDDKPFLHIHCVISDESFHCFGGHLKEAVVSGTLEAIIEKLDVSVERKMDDEVGLNLLDFESN